MNIITPNEIAKLKQNSIPEQVFECFNKLIVDNFNGYASHIKLEDIANLIASTLNIPSTNVYKNNWLDVEDIYRKAGWQVEYDQPGYNETYDAYFVFTKPKTKGNPL